MDNVVTPVTLSDVPGLFTGTTNPPEVAEDTENTEQPVVTTDAPDAPAETTPPAEDPVTPPVEDTTKSDPARKANEAFAKLRTDNAAKSKMLTELATLLGVDSKDDSVMLEALKAKIIENKAKTQNVSPEILTELESLRARQEEFDRSQRRQVVQQAFTDLKSEFDLSASGIQDFIAELGAANLNPFASDVDLKAEYLKRHFADIRNKAVEEGVRKEVERAQKALNNSTTPAVPGGNRSGVPNAKVNSVKDLEAFLAQIEK